LLVTRSLSAPVDYLGFASQENVIEPGTECIDLVSKQARQFQVAEGVEEVDLLRRSAAVY